MTGVSNFQIVGFALSLGIIAIILRQQRVGIFNEDLVLVSSILCMFTQIFDILFKIFVIQLIPVPMFLVNFTCKLSLIFALSSVIIMAMLIMIDFLPEDKHNQEALISLIICLIFGAIIIVTNLNSSFENGEVIITGLSNLIAHLLILLIVAYIIVFSIIKRKKLSRVKKLTIGFWCFVIVQGTLLNFYFNEVQCLGFNVVLALYIIISLAENIENHYNNLLESFNHESFYSYISIKYSKKAKLSLLYLYAFNDYDDYRKEQEIDKVIDEALAKIKKRIKVHAFRTQTNELIICSKNQEHINDLSYKLKAYIEDYQQNIDYTHRFYSLIINVSDISVSDTYTDLLKTFESYKEHVSKDPLNITYIDLNNKYVEQRTAENQLLKVINEAISNDEIYLTIQPIFNSHTKKVELFEAKSYIVDNDKIINYEKILSRIEKNERFILCSKSMIEKACDVYKKAKLINQHIKGFVISFLSYQLEDQSLTSAIIDAIANNNINSNCVYIKLIDLKYIQNKKLFLSNIKKLTDFGVKILGINTDDNGLQVEDISASYTDGVIVNHRFLQKSINDSKVNVIFNNMCQLAHKLNKDVFVNGLVSEELINSFDVELVDYIQGKQLSKWVNSDDFIKYVKEGNI